MELRPRRFKNVWIPLERRKRERLRRAKRKDCEKFEKRMEKIRAQFWLPLN